MRNLENLLNKILGYLRTEEFFKILMILYMWIAILNGIYGNYLMLAVAVFYLVRFIAEHMIKKIFFKKLYDYLMKTPKTTALIYVIIYVIFIALSVEHFIGVILSAILAFVEGDFIKSTKKV